MINIEYALAAKKLLEPGIWNYLVGGSEDELALRRNRNAFQDWAFIPRVLIDVSQLNLTKTIFNIPLKIPVIGSPIGGLTKMHEKGDSEWARGIAQAEIVGAVSGVARIKPQEIIKGSNANLLFQLYFYGNYDWVKEQVQMAEKCGYQAIILTVDTPYYGLRERDILGKFDPRQVGWSSAPPPPDRSCNVRLNWASVKRIQTFTSLPFIIKGIVNPEDVQIAAEHGVAAIWLSNHGGRQLDYSLPTLEVLTRIAPTCRKYSLPIVFDGGIRRGSDVLLALLLGADVVAVGRLPIYGLAVDGANGMKTVFENLENELRTAMGLVGLTSLSFNYNDLQDRLVRRDDSPLSTRWDEIER